MENKIKKRYDRIAGLYDILDKPMEAGFSRWREIMLKEAKGETLEVGIGTGKNIPYYPEDIKLTGIDFSPEMLSKAKKKKHKSNIDIRLLEMDAENMDFRDNSFDTVVTSCVFCSVPDPVQGLKEIRRVCKKEGQILMLEHVRSNKKVIGELMDLFNPLPVHIYGANINRRTYDNLLKAGFKPEQIDVENIWMDILKIFRIQNN